MTAISPGAVQTEFSNIRFKVGRLYCPPSGLCYLHVRTAALMRPLQRTGPALSQCLLLTEPCMCGCQGMLAEMGV